MMTLLQSVFLGIIQGLTEFLPISSSGHLVLLEHFFQIQIPESSLKGFDVILHFGTLLAIIFYFWQDLVMIGKGLKQAIKERRCNTYAFRFKKILFATIPVLVVGFFFNDWLDEHFRTPQMVAIMLAITGVLLILSEKFPAKKELYALNLKQAFLVGFFQIFALIPGISRSGITISTALFQGITREAAARFSFLLAIPSILAAVGYILLQGILGKIIFPAPSILILGFITSFLSSYFCVKFLMHFIRKHTLSVFSWYLFIVSGILLLS